MRPFTLRKCALILFAFLSIYAVNAQSTYEFNSTGANSSTPGPTTNDQSVTFIENTNNPNGNTATAIASGLKATFSISDQQYDVSTSLIGSGKAVNFGGNSSSTTNAAQSAFVYGQMITISSPSDSLFTSYANGTSGTGIDINNNYGVRAFVSARPLYDSSLSTNNSYYFGKLTIQFNSAIDYPVLQIVGLGAVYFSSGTNILGITTDLLLDDSDLSMSLLSGNSNFTVVGDSLISNSATHPDYASTSGAASGSVLVNAQNVSTITFKIIMRSDGNLSAWGQNNVHSGDAFYIGLSSLKDVPVHVSGNLWDDADGNGLQNNGEQSFEPSAKQYVYLVNSNNKVVDSAHVRSNGAYTLRNVPDSANNMKLITSTQNLKHGEVLSTATVPTNWIITAENNGGVVDGVKDGRFTGVQTHKTNLSGYNFGLEQLPNTHNKVYNLASSPNPNQVYKMNGISNPPVLSGSDPEDGAYLDSGRNYKITDTTGMLGNLIFYDTNGNDTIDAGELLVPGSIITGLYPSKMKLMITKNKSETLNFNYAMFDNAGKIDPSPAGYTVNWSSPVPVDLIYFSTNCSDQQVLISWSTAQELNNDYFSLQRSIDGLNWNEIANIKGAGTTSEIQEYRHVDQRNITNKQYYRLVQVDYDRQSKVYASEITICEDLAISLLYPNPTKGEVDLVVSDEIIEISITDVLGQLIEDYHVDIYSNRAHIDLNNLSSGNYQIKAKTRSGDVVKPVNVIR